MPRGSASRCLSDSRGNTAFGEVNAVSDFDADDVEGPLDLRWVGASLTQDGEFRVTIPFYDGFRVSALPKVRHGLLRGRGHVFVDLTEFISGVYVRRQGKIVFLYETSAQAAGPTSRVRASEHG
jgi:hypothetical protein